MLWCIILWITKMRIGITTILGAIQVGAIAGTTAGIAGAVAVGTLGITPVSILGTRLGAGIAGTDLGAGTTAGV
jgi:hypothetical protein